MSKPIRVAVTGGAGQINYNLLFRIANGDLFGPNQPVALNILELPVAMEIMAQMTIVAGRKIDGLNIFNPPYIKVGMIPLISQVPANAPTKSRIIMAPVVDLKLFPTSSNICS